MWNINIQRGKIWSVKSLNEYDYNYQGMTFGMSNVLILSAFYDKTTDIKKFTYLKISKYKSPFRLYEQVILEDGSTMYVQIDELSTGDQRALGYYVGSLNFEQTNKIVEIAKQYFNLKKSKTENYITSFKKPVKNEGRSNNTQIIHKFGIDINVTPNQYVSISKSGRLNLDKKVKDDIVYNTNSDMEFNFISQKYGISPIKAIHEIKNRLVYQYKNK